MTQEEKLKEAERLYKTANADQKYVLESLFPELKESEDERIRKNLIELFHDIVSNDEIFSDYGLDKTEVLAWLEKQEEKPVEEYNITGITSGQATGKLAEIIKDIESADKIEALRTEYAKGRADAIAEMQVAWSEDDEKILRTIISDGIRGAEFDMLQINWLKALKDRVQPKSQWKPSDEQIKVCKEVYAALLSAKGCNVGIVNSEINRLEEQLKKLREE